MNAISNSTKNDRTPQLNENTQKVHDCIDEFFVDIEGLSSISDTIGVLMSTFVADKNNDWTKDFLTKTVDTVGELNTFLVNLHEKGKELHEHIDGFYGFLSTYPNTIETLGFLLSAFVVNLDYNWNNNIRYKTAYNVAALNTLLAKLYVLQNERDQILFYPDGDLVMWTPDQEACS